MSSLRISPTEVTVIAEKTLRCVHCARPKAMHTGEDLSCGAAYKTKFGTMELPDGKACGDCHYLVRCITLGYTASAEMTRCDFFPIKFVAKEDRR